MLRNCCQIRRILEQPALSREPEHRFACGVLKACDGGSEFYLRHLDAEWRDEGQRKLDGWKVGPPLCSSFEAEHPGGCAGCYFFDGSKTGDERFKISSPTHAGRIIVRGQEGQAEPAPAQADREEHAQEGAQSSTKKLNGHHHPLGAIGIDLSKVKLPHPFGWDEENRLVRYPKDPADKDVKPLVISTYPIYLASIHRSEASRTTGCTYAFNQWHPHDGWHSIAVPASDLWTNRALPKLADGNANILQAGEFREYVMRHVDVINKSGPPTAQYEQCGWKKDETGKRVAFVLGSLRLKRGLCENVVVSDELHRRSNFLGPTKNGSIEAWRAAIDQYLPPHDWTGWWVILCSLGSIFMSFQHHTESGGIVNVREISSGTGKTSKLLGAASAWGQWEGCLVRNYDTDASAGHILSVLNHLPCFQDELDKKIQANSKNPEWLSNYTNRLTEGGDKQRMEMGGKKLQVAMLPYQLHLLTATNHPLHDYSTAFGRGSDAVTQRITELRSQVLPHLTVAAHEHLQAELFKNAGWAGYYMVEWILASDENMAFVENKIKWWSNWLYNNTNFRHKHRFTVRSIICAAVAGEVAHEMGGMLPCNFRWVIDSVLQDLRAFTGMDRPDESIRGGDGIAALGEFYDANIAERLIVSGPYVPGTISYQPPQQNCPRNRLVFRIEQSNHRMLFTHKSFRAFCIATGYSFTDCIQDLEKSGALVHRERLCVLGAGTTYAGARERCIEIDTSHPAVIGLPRLVEASNDR